MSNHRCNNIIVLLFSTILWSSYVYGTPVFNTVNDYDLNGNKCPLPTKRGVKCPTLCVSDVKQCPEKVSSNCPQGQTFCQDGKCHESCPADIINPCSCGAENNSWTLYPCSTASTVLVDLPNFYYAIEKNLTTQHCSESFGLQNTPKVYDGSDPGSSMWAICPLPPPPVFTYREPMWIAVFSIVAFQALFLMVWHSYKTFAERNAIHMIASEFPPSLNETGLVASIQEKSASSKSQSAQAND
ncbi:hypothetical protein CONCODRAFT_2788, partial [Conidiobolus coronatus NRRL 28638]